MIFCTLFDSNYLDKGCVMIDSLKQVKPDCLVAVLCMDDLCEKVLSNEYPSVITISLKDFLDDDLCAIKEKRSKGEFCWSCTAKLIKYVLKKYDQNICTYVDSDLFFYSDPSILIEEMEAKGCCVQTIAHNFPPNIFRKTLENKSGKNCVEFLTFSKNEMSIKLLDSWIAQCINECSIETGGDQKYTDKWNSHRYVNISSNLGAGLAPWNISRFRKKDYVIDKYTKKKIEPIFYHFQNVVNSERNLVKIEPLYNYLFLDKKYVYQLYLPYLRKLEEKKLIIEKKYGFCPIIYNYITSNIGKKSFFSIPKPYFYTLYYALVKRLCKIFRGKRGYINTKINIE